MSDFKRVFVLGAGFSKSAGMPLATELLPLLVEKVEIDRMAAWLKGFCDRLKWLDGTGLLDFNIEQVFHNAQSDIEVWLLRQHLSSFGRYDGETPHVRSEEIANWLGWLEYFLQDVISECDVKADLSPLTRWADVVDESDAVLTFNYDTLTERSLSAVGKGWSHGFELENRSGIPVFKLHGSIDWMVADRREPFSNLQLLFDKKNHNHSGEVTGFTEEDYRLWRWKSPKKRENWIRCRYLQGLPEGADPRTVGIAGLGQYKPLHRIPGLGVSWTGGMRALYLSDLAVIVGFAMSDFDAFAQLQFAEVARARHKKKRPLRVLVIDPGLDKDEPMKKRFQSVFRDVNVRFEVRKHEEFDWSTLADYAPLVGAA